MMMLDKEKNNFMIKMENNHYLLTNKNFRGGLWAYLLEEYEGGVWYDTLYDKKKLNYAIQYIVMITIKVLTEKLSLHNLKTHLKKRNG